MENRNRLPFRINCEGYFIDNDRNILAKNSSEGFLVFPGGGVDNNEKIEDAIFRETLEETGAIAVNLEKIGELKFIWGENWAKTEKQKKRYQKFRGEDMHFFFGVIKGFAKVDENTEDFWTGEKLLPLREAVRIIEKCSPLEKEIKKYRGIQLKFLKKILEGQIK